MKKTKERSVKSKCERIVKIKIRKSEFERKIEEWEKSITRNYIKEEINLLKGEVAEGKNKKKCYKERRCSNEW